MSVLLLVLTILLWVLGLLAGLLLLLIAALLLLPLDLLLRIDPDLAAEDWEGEVHGSLPWQARIRFGWGLLKLELAGEGLQPGTAQFSLIGLRLRSGGPQARQPAGPEAEAKARAKAKAKAEAKAKAKAGAKASDRAGSARKSAQKRPKQRLPWEVLRELIRESVYLVRRLWRDLGLDVTGDLTYGFPDPALTGIGEAALGIVGRPAGMRVQPDFLRSRLEGWAQVEGSLFGVQVLIQLLRVLKNPVLRRYVMRRLFGKLRFRIRKGGRFHAVQ